MTAQVHAAAVLDRLRTSGTPGLSVHDTRVPDAAVPPYVLVRIAVQALGAGDRPDASNLVGQSLPVQVTVRAYSVGATAQAARALVNRVAVALLDWTPVVAGRSCTPARHLDAFESAPDEQTGTPYFELGDIYRFTSHPA